jgi:hypothetical protein
MKWRALGALLCLVALLCVAAKIEPQKVTKQEGGSTGDSVVAADTSASIFVREDVTGLWVNGLNDSATVYYLQVSPDTTSTKFKSVDSMTVAKGWAGSTTDLASKWSGWRVRVIQVCDSASTSAWGNAWIVTVRP